MLNYSNDRLLLSYRKNGCVKQFPNRWNKSASIDDDSDFPSVYVLIKVTAALCFPAHKVPGQPVYLEIQKHIKSKFQNLFFD